MPGTACRSRAISSVTLCAGSCPPSPGLAPCTILISSSSARTRYSVVTPNRAEATCLIRLSSAVAVLAARGSCCGSSPPSPELDRAPIRFIAIESVACASGESAPSDIAEETNRRRISSTDSTSSSGTGVPGRTARRSRGLAGRRASCLARNPCVGLGAIPPSPPAAAPPPAVVPSRDPHPPCGSGPVRGREGRAAPSTRARTSTSSASSSNPIPPRGEAVPSKQVSITSCPRPSTSKICAPQ